MQEKTANSLWNQPFNLEVGGVEPPSYDAVGGLLQVCTAVQGCRGAGGGPSRYRLRSPLIVPPVPRAWRGVSPGWVAGRTRSSGLGAAGPVAIGAYAARARVPLSLALESLPRVGDRRSTCDPRTGPAQSKPGHPLAEFNVSSMVFWVKRAGFLARRRVGCVDRPRSPRRRLRRAGPPESGAFQGLVERRPPARPSRISPSRSHR